VERAPDASLVTALVTALVAVAVLVAVIGRGSGP
jgi:hypothetical protein